MFQDLLLQLSRRMTWQENDRQGCPNLTLGTGRGAKGP